MREQTPLTMERASYHARAWKHVPAESDAISVLDLRPLVLQGFVLILIHLEKLGGLNAEWAVKVEFRQWSRFYYVCHDLRALELY